MSTRSFWKIQSAKDKSGTPTTTPSTSNNDVSDSNTLDLSSSSIRHSDEKSGMGATALTAPPVESSFLWKQPSKRRFLGGSNPQKRYFVLTPNELAYKEKDNDDAEFKAVWRIPQDVIRVEAPEEGSKDFEVVVMQNGTQRAVKLSAADAATAQKFASAVNEAIKSAASTPKGGAVESAIQQATTTSANTGAAMMVEDVMKPAESKLGEDQPSIFSIVEENSLETTEAEVVQEPNASTISTELAASDAPVPIPVQEVSQSPKEESKPVVWFWTMCCAAE